MVFTYMTLERLWLHAILILEMSFQVGPSALNTICVAHHLLTCDSILYFWMKVLL